MRNLNLGHRLNKKREMIDENPIPLGDKGIPGERDDMFNPQVTDKFERYKHLQRYKYASKRCKGRILDIGCGTGYGTKTLDDKGNEVYGIDNSQKAINYAKKTYPGPEYICCSAEKLSFENNYFDAIVAFEVIEHVQSPEQVLDEIYRVLKNDGDLFISTPNPRHLKNVFKHILLGKPYPPKINMDNIYHLKEFYYDEFINMLEKKKFRIISQYGQELPLPSKIMVLFAKFPFIYNIPILLGFTIPKYAQTIVIHAKK